MSVRRVLVVLLLCLPVTAGPVAAQGALTCDLCRSAIKGQYKVYQGGGVTLNVCASCETSHAKCPLCRVPMSVTDIRLVSGHQVCRRCAPSALVCSGCGDLVQGAYMKSGDGSRVFCSDCFRTRPRCARCSLPVSAEEDRLSIPAVGGRRICAQCDKEAERCKGCGETLIGLSYSYNGSSDKFCERCHLGDHCSACGEPLGEGGWDLPDGRHSCDACQKTAIHDMAEAQRILRRIETILRRDLNMTLRRPYQFELVHKDNPDLQITSPVKNNELGLFVLRGEEARIYILSGLPAGLYYETAAHELAHAWQAENCPLEQDQKIREGFAQWVAAKVLMSIKEPKILRLLTERKDVYGEGYRYFRSLELQEGRSAVFEKARQ